MPIQARTGRTGFEPVYFLCDREADTPEHPHVLSCTVLRQGIKPVFYRLRADCIVSYACRARVVAVGFEPTMFTLWVSGLQPGAVNRFATLPCLLRHISGRGGIRTPEPDLQDRCFPN